MGILISFPLIHVSFYEADILGCHFEACNPFCQISTCLWYLPAYTRLYLTSIIHKFKLDFRVPNKIWRRKSADFLDFPN